MALSEGMNSRELGLQLNLESSDKLAIWLGRLVDFGIVKSIGRTNATRYFVDPELLSLSSIQLPTTLKRIEPHRLQELLREDLRRYPGSKIGEISSRVGTEINRSLLKRALGDLTLRGIAVMEGKLSGARYRLADKD